MQIDGAVAIVTGAAGGIGAAIAQQLLENGASVVITDLDAARVEERVDALRAFREDRVAGLAGDCSDETRIRDAIALAEERFGPVDLYAANAGVGLGQGLDAPDEQWQASLEVNVMAHVRAARLLVPAWLERGRGYFLSTASAAGLLTQIGSPTYTVSKHGAVAFAEWLAVTYGSRGIAVSCLCPMGVNTAMLTGGADSDQQDARRAARAVTDAGGVLEPLEVADVVMDALRDERFLVLPHPEVLDFHQRKAGDRDRWIAGMQRYQDSLG